MERGWLIVLAFSLTACGGGGPTSALGPTVNAADVRACLTSKVDANRWKTIPLSDFGGTVFGIDFGTNSVQIYVEKDSASVSKESDSIRAGEAQLGYTKPSQKVILHPRGNVLVSWANEPTAEQSKVVETCAGFS